MLVIFHATGTSTKRPNEAHIVQPSDSAKKKNKKKNKKPIPTPIEVPKPRNQRTPKSDARK
jgi:hypothetical protein